MKPDGIFFSRGAPKLFSARHKRQDPLVDILALTSVILALGGQKALLETVRAIQDVGRWWP
jgi:hypothetical protein